MALTPPPAAPKVHASVNYRGMRVTDHGTTEDELDPLFAALANPHRRDMVRLLALQPQSISRLAAARGLSLPAMNRHVGVLLEAGLIRRRKIGRTTFLALDRAAMRRLSGWLGQFQPWWGTDDETLQNYEAYLASEPPGSGETR
jgi:DNA-binding transcriptional ArsR family regulator